MAVMAVPVTATFDLVRQQNRRYGSESIGRYRTDQKG